MTSPSFDALRERLEGFALDLAELIYLPSTVARLRLQWFRDGSPTEISATTIVGLYRGLSDWYLRAGEGRVETIKAVIDAERASRRVSGAIVFDSGKRIRWRQGLDRARLRGRCRPLRSTPGRSAVHGAGRALERDVHDP